MSAPFLLWMLPVLFTLHELEEWNILDWYRRHYPEMPASTPTSIRLWLVLASLTSWAWAALVTLSWPLPWLGPALLVAGSVIALVNAAQHVLWTIQYRTYSPGLATGLALMGGILVVHVDLVTRGAIGIVWYLLLVVGWRPLVNTWNSPHRLTDDLRRVHELGIRLARWLNR